MAPLMVTVAHHFDSLQAKLAMLKLQTCDIALLE